MNRLHTTLVAAPLLVVLLCLPSRAENFALVHVACGHQPPSCPTCWSHHLIVFTVGKSNGATVECSYAYKWRLTDRAPATESEWEARICDRKHPAMPGAGSVTTWQAPTEPPHKCMPRDVVQLDRVSGRFRVCVTAPNLDCSDGVLPE